MNTGQTMLTIAAMFLLSVLILRSNRIFMTTNSVMLDTKFAVLGTSIATSIIEEANNKAFDQSTDTSSVYNLNELTNSGSLGPEVDEVYEVFNDIDDYNGYTGVDSSMPSAKFNIDCSVFYVTSSNLNDINASKTWNKKITVTISSESMTDTIRMSSIFSYWFFR